MRIVKKTIRRRIDQKINGKNFKMGLIKNERNNIRNNVSNSPTEVLNKKSEKVITSVLKKNIKVVNDDVLNKGKSLKLICCYFGKRRTTANTPEDITEFLKLNLQNEIDIENGMDTDVLIVNNDAGNVEKNEWLFNTYNNKRTKNGKITVETRPNIGGSFGAYYYGFFKYWKQYDYWFFCEDDVLIFKENYMRNFANLMDVNYDVSFISLAPIRVGTPKLPTHSGGGCGLTSTNIFLRQHDLRKLEDNQKNIKADSGYVDLQKLEVIFTNNFISKEYELTNHPNYSPYPENYKKNVLYKNFQIEDENLEYIYNIGF